MNDSGETECAYASECKWELQILFPQRPTRLFLRSKRIRGREIVLSRAMTTRPSKKLIEEVNEQLRLWIKLNAELSLTVGDSLRSRASIRTISEPNAGAFFFTNLRAATIDTLTPQQSELIKITLDYVRLCDGSHGTA